MKNLIERINQNIKEKDRWPAIILSLALFPVVAATILAMVLGVTRTEEHRTIMLNENKVVGMRYEPLDTNSLLIPFNFGEGSIIWIEYLTTDNPDWVITIEYTASNRKMVKDIYVSKELYDRTKVGSRLIFDEPGSWSEADNNNGKKEKEKKR